MNIWFTSDLHMSHDKEFLWGPRGFKNQHEMNEAIVERWNNVIEPDDIVYNLGDIALSDTDDAIEYLKKLNGTQWWIRGNHDTQKKIETICKACPRISLISNPEASWATMIIYEKKYHFLLTHYPTLTANFDTGKHFSQNVINLHGHIHSKNNWMIPTNPFIYHVGVDSHNCTPVHIDEILSDIKQRWNEIGKLPQNLKPEDTYPYEKNPF